MKGGWVGEVCEVQYIHAVEPASQLTESLGAEEIRWSFFLLGRVKGPGISGSGDSHSDQTVSHSMRALNFRFRTYTNVK